MGKLRDLLIEEAIEEAKFLSNVGHKVRQVEEDLRRMNSMLIDADKWSGPDSKRLQKWMNDLQNLAFKAENVLEEYAVEVTSRKEGRTLTEKLERFACILCECFGAHKVGKEVENIRSRLAYLTDELTFMSGGEGGSTSSDAGQQDLSRLTFNHDDVEEHFVGMEEDINRLVSMVKDGEEDRRPVVAICGMGGLGKTTLARKIYHHKDVEGCYARAWVCVTQQFQPKTVLGEVLRQFLEDDKKDKINNMGHTELVTEIQNYMKKKKCLVVVDDIWERDHWVILKKAFPTTTASRVLLTSRKKDIVDQDYVYELDVLTEDQGWELLHKIAIPDGSGLSSFENIGRHTVRKCGRLPLAISVVGGILRQKKTFAEWEKVNSNIDSYLKRGEGIEINKGVMQVLDLSYDVLPYYLKPCFLYLACFPEDEEIETRDLYLLWIAEGLISSQDKGSNETQIDVAERYLSELAFRCMVQLQEYGWHFGTLKVLSCRLHDLVRDLSSSKAEEINFLKRLSYPKQPYDERPSSVVFPRVVVHFENENDNFTTLSIDGIQKVEDLRSLLILPRKKYGRLVSFQDSTIDFSKSKCLRVLAINKCLFESKKLPRKLDKLIHLRYLTLFRSTVEELPRSICNIPYLHTLDLRVIGSIKLPNVIYKMKKLRHLWIDDFSVIGGGKLKLDGLKELETLETISSNNVCIDDILKLTNLRRLVIDVYDIHSASILADYMRGSRLREASVVVKHCNFSSGEGPSIFRNILMSPSLVSLSIYFCEFGCSFPSYEQGMSIKLVMLSLYDCNIEGDLMGILGKFPVLLDLSIWEVTTSEPTSLPSTSSIRTGTVSAKERAEAGANVPTNLIFGANSFPQLRTLFLLQLNLRKWEVEEGAMPKLTELTIAHCRNVEGLPLIRTLRKLEMWGMPKEFNDKFRVVNGQPGEEYDKVFHIPYVRLFDSEERNQVPAP